MRTMQKLEYHEIPRAETDEEPIKTKQIESLSVQNNETAQFAL